MRRRTWITLLLLTVPLLSGCFGSAPQGSAWQEERDAHGPVGLEATFSGRHTEPLVTGTGTLAPLEAPFVLAPSTRVATDAPLVFFTATVQGHGAGTLLLEGAEIIVARGVLADAPVSRVSGAGSRVAMTLPEPFTGVPPAPTGFPADLQAEESVGFFAESVPLSASGLQVQSFTRALFIADGNATNLTAPVDFAASALHWGAGSALEAGSVTVAWEEFAWAAANGTGTLHITGRAPVSDPLGVFGHDARLRVTPTELSSDGPFRLVQATTSEGFLLPASIELDPAAEAVTVPQGGEKWVKVFYRESSFEGAAIFRDVEVTGTGAALITLPLDHPPLHIEQLWDILDEQTTLAQPFLALAFAAVSPAVVLIDVLEGIACVFGECPGKYPYPVWMDPGDIGRFYYRVSGEGPAGEYEATITIRGENHEPVSIPLTITVTGGGDGHAHTH